MTVPEISHGAKVTAVVGTEKPVSAVAHHEPEAEDVRDSGYSVLLSDAPEDPFAIPEELKWMMQTV